MTNYLSVNAVSNHTVLKDIQSTIPQHLQIQFIYTCYFYNVLRNSVPWDQRPTRHRAPNSRMYVKHLCHFHKEFSLHFCQLLPACQSCAMVTNIFLSTATQKKKKAEPNRVIFLSDFPVQSQLWPMPWTPVSHHTVTCPFFLTLEQPLLKSSVSFKVHSMYFLSCSQWLKFTVWKRSFPDVTKSACSDSAVS